VPQGAELTEAGVTFRRAVEQIPGTVDRAVHAAQRAGRGETGALRVGYTGSAKFHRAVPNAIRQFRRRWPDIRLTLVEQNSIDLARALEENLVDIAFLRPPSVDSSDVVLDTVMDEGMLVLPTSHALAQRPVDAPPLAAICDEPLVLTTPEAGRTLFNVAVETCRAAGFEPLLGQVAPQIGSILALVAAEFGVSIVPASMRHMALDGVTYRDIEDVDASVRLALAHRRGDTGVVMRNFLIAARPKMIA
jgi:DNA-binding transcriptional LysR family regulator